MIVNTDSICIVDDTNEILDSNEALFLKTKLNSKYIDKLPNNIKIISPKELDSYLLRSFKLIGITGTNGKTTTLSCIYFLLSNLGYKCATLGTRGFFINGVQINPRRLTTPSLLEISYNMHLASLDNCDYFIMEVSSHGIAQGRIEGLNFDIKILSNIQSDHLDFHETYEEYIKVKNSFFSDSGLKLINRDCKNAAFNIENLYTYGIENISNFKVDAYGVRDCIDAHITFNDFKNKTKESGMLFSNLLGKHNLYNLLASISCVKLLNANTSLNEICLLLSKFNGVEGRMEIVHRNPTVIVDFAHTPDGMKNIFEAFRGLHPKVLFGAGGDRDRFKRKEMGAIAQRYAKKIYITSDNPRNENPHSIIQDILEGITNVDSVLIESNRKIAIQKALQELNDDEILLILGKGDERYQIIGDQLFDFDDRLEVLRYYGINNAS